MQAETPQLASDGSQGLPEGVKVKEEVQVKDEAHKEPPAQGGEKDVIIILDSDDSDSDADENEPDTPAPPISQPLPRETATVLHDGPSEPLLPLHSEINMYFKVANNTSQTSFDAEIFDMQLTAQGGFINIGLIHGLRGKRTPKVAAKRHSKHIFIAHRIPLSGVFDVIKPVPRVSHKKMKFLDYDEPDMDDQESAAGNSDEDDEEEDTEEEFLDFIDDAPLDGSEANTDPEFAQWYSGWIVKGEEVKKEIQAPPPQEINRLGELSVKMKRKEDKAFTDEEWVEFHELHRHLNEVKQEQRKEDLQMSLLKLCRSTYEAADLGERQVASAATAHPTGAAHATGAGKKAAAKPKNPIMRERAKERKRVRTEGGWYEPGSLAFVDESTRNSVANGLNQITPPATIASTTTTTTTTTTTATHSTQLPFSFKPIETFTPSLPIHTTRTPPTTPKTESTPKPSIYFSMNLHTQHATQTATQHATQHAPQTATQHVPQTHAPKAVMQNTTQHAPQTATQYAPQTTTQPHTAIQHVTPQHAAHSNTHNATQTPLPTQARNILEPAQFRNILEQSRAQSQEMRTRSLDIGGMYLNDTTDNDGINHYMQHINTINNNNSINTNNLSTNYNNINTPSNTSNNLLPNNIIPNSPNITDNNNVYKPNTNNINIPARKANFVNRPPPTSVEWGGEID